MRFGILGATRVLGADGCEVALGGPRRRATLALLLLDAGRMVGVERLVDGLYGQDAPAGVGNAVQSQISRLRQVLPVAVEGHPAGYRLVAEPDEVDVHRFTRLSAAGREALAQGAAEKAEELLGEALALWRGPALADVGDAPFAAAQVVRLEELRVAALEDRAEARLALGRHRELVAELGELVASHPLRERLRGQLMRALYASGRQGEALAAYEAARRELADSLGADPGPELAAVHLAVLRGDPSLMPDVPRGTSASAPLASAPLASAPRAASTLASTPVSTASSAPHAVPNAASATGDFPEPPHAPRHELPAQLTSFVGRATELGRIGELLASGRLVTLIGPGGAGKTRLAVEAAGRYAHDAAFVELAGLTAGADVPQAVLGALGLREGGLLASGGPGAHAPHPPAAAGAPDPVARIAAALDGRPALLVLDNCEHLVADAAALAERLLAAVRGLRVLATSREALGINGETLCPVAPLELPPPGTATEQALASPAVRLFTDRATAVRPDFDPAADPDAVVRLCTVLDGLPLAIELAAARLRSMSVTEIAARLGTPADDALPYSLGVRPDALFRLLSRGSRTAQPRQRTLRAVVDWSWDLLPEDERAVLRRASVFAGGWTLEAAEAVCADPVGPAPSREGAGIAPDDLLDVVAALVEKSLCLAQPPDPAGRVRYRMLESIRAYGAERLAEAGETAATRRAHTAYFLDFALTADPYLRGPAQLDWLRRLSDDRDNLHAALHRSLAAGDIPTAMRLIAALSSYWLLRGMRYEGVEPARRVLAAVGPHPPEGMEEEYALCVMAVVSTLPDAREYAEHVAAAAAVVEAGYRLARRYPVLTLLWAPFAGVPERSPETEAGIDRFLRETGDPWYRALIHLGHGFQAWVIGADAETARRECETSLEGFRRQGERWGMITCLGVLADLADYQGDLLPAVALLGQAQVLAEELDSTLDMADLLCNRAARSLRAGDHAAATAFCERAVELSRRAGAPEILAMAHLGLAEAARLRGDLAAARELAEQALAECPMGWFSSNGTRLSVLLGLGRICVAEGDAAGARRCFGEAVAAERLAAQFPLTAAAAAAAVAGLALLEGDPRAAARLLGAARSLRGRAAGGPDADAAEAGARDALGGEAYEEALAAARALPRDEALGALHRYLADT